MNTLTNGLLKRALSILLVTIMVLSLGIVGITSASAAEVELAETGARPNVIYFKPNSNWTQASAWFLVHFYDDDNTGDYADSTSIKMLDDNSDGIYSVAVPNSAYNRVQFFRKDPSDSSLSTSSFWDQSNALWLQDNGNDLLTLDSGWSNIDGTWSKHNQVYLSGSFNNWSLDKDKMTASGNTYTKTLSLAANTTYSFKVFEKGTYYSVNATMTSTSCTNYNLYTNSDNLKITTTLAGNYTFTFYSDTKKLTVTYPTPTVKVTATHSTPCTVGAPVTITANTTGSSSTPTLSFTVKNEAGNIVTGKTSGSTYTITPTVSGTYNYTVKATIGSTSKSFDGTFTVNLPDLNFVVYAVAENDTVNKGETVTINVASDDTNGGTVEYKLYNVDGETLTDTGLTLSENSYTIDTTDMAVGTYTYKVGAVVTAENGEKYDEVFSDPINITVEQFIFGVTLTPSKETVAYSDMVNLTVGYNADLVSCELFGYIAEKDEWVEIWESADIESNALHYKDGDDYRLTHSIDDIGECKYKIVATSVDGETAEATATITVTDYTTASVILSASSSINYGDNIVLTATPAGNITGALDEYKVFTYKFYQENGAEDILLDTNTKGTFSIPTTAEDVNKSYTYYVVLDAYVKDYDGKYNTTFNDTSDTVTVKVVIKEGTPDFSGERKVTIYFKSAESYGYLPSISFDGGATYTAMSQAKAITEENGGSNSTNTGHYYWYTATTTTTNGAVINFKVNSNRFFKECSASLDIKQKYGEDNTFTYYFAIDNLNDPAGKVENVTDNENRDVCVSIIDMIADAPALTQLAAVGTTFRSVDFGDANDDGKLNVRDATIIQKDLAQMTDLSEVGSLVADFNGDGKVTIKDATAIQKAVAGL